MNSSIGVYPQSPPEIRPDGRILRRDQGTFVIPVSRRYRQMTRRLEQIERQLERLAALDAPGTEFVIIGVPEDAAEMTSMCAR